MAKFCEICGKKLSLFSGGTICKECKVAREAEVARKKAELSAELSNIQGEIIRTKDVTEQQIEILKKQDRKNLVNLYSAVYTVFELDQELEEDELNTLKKIQDTFYLSNEEVSFDDRVRPYIYVYAIRKEGTLPTVNLKIVDSSPVVLKKSEVVHFADKAVL
ncbi:MAG: hypothetical protein MUO99_08020, partial [Dehalococcoidales bacterium]|nr:hypothetical protein [Dehalococcoidales bacterium]